MGCCRIAGRLHFDYVVKYVYVNHKTDEKAVGKAVVGLERLDENDGQLLYLG